MLGESKSHGFPLLKHRRIQTKFKTLESIYIYCYCHCGDDGLKWWCGNSVKSGIITDVSTKKLLRRMHLGIAPSATHNYLILLLLFFASEFSLLLPFIVKGLHLYLLCTTSHCYTYQFFIDIC